MAKVNDSVAEQAEHVLFVSNPCDLDIERICRDCSEGEQSLPAFMVAAELVAGQLLAISKNFLEEGQQLPCPGLPLAGAAFHPGWGFSAAEVGIRQDGSAEFRLPSMPFETLDYGDTHGYRLCILNADEVPEAVRQLARIRAELAQQDRQSTKRAGIKITITQL